MNKCEHGQRINYFCATDCCVWKEASGCEVCIRKYHNHMGTTVFLNEEDISSILKKFTIESQSKPKCRMLQEAIYSYFTAIKAEISSSIDIVCKNLIYQIGYPYLNAVNSLPTYRRLKNKQYRKLGQKDFKNFYELSQKISDKELVSQQSKIYLKQLKGAAQLMSTLEDAFKQYETGVKRYHSNFVHDVQPAYRIKQLLMSLNINESSNMNGREFKKIDNLFGFNKERQEDKTNNYKAQQKKPFQLHKNGMTVLSSADRPNYSRDVSIDRKIIKQPLFVGQVQTVGKQSSQKQISPPKLGGFLQRQKSQRIQHTRPQMNKRELQISQKKKMLMEMMKQKQERDTIPAPEKTFNESIVIGKQRFAESPKVSEEKQVNSSYQWNQTAKKQMNHLKPPTNFPRKISINQNLNTMTNSVKIPQNRKLAAQKLALSLNISQAIGKRQPQKSVQKGEKKFQSEQMNINVQETKSIGFQNQNISDKSQKGSEEQSEQEEQKANLDINYAFTQLPVQQKAPKRMGLADRVGKKLIVIPTIGLQKDQQDEIKSPLLKKKNKMDRYKESLKIKQPIPQTTTMQQEAISEKQVKQNFKQPECFVPSHRRTETQLELKQNEQISLALLLKSLALKAEEAIVYLQKALVHAENNLSAAEYLSFLYLQLDRPLDCLKLCNKTLQKIENSNEPDDLSLMLNNNKAAALNILGRYSESIVLLQKCLRHREKDLFYKNLGDAYSSISIYEKAIYSYEKALKLNDQLDEAHYNLAVCLFGQLNYNNAKLAIQKAIDLNPTNMQYHELLKNIVTRIYHY